MFESQNGSMAALHSLAAAPHACRYARWLGKEYITSIRDPADPEPDSPLCKVFQKMEEAAATIGYKPRFDAWWTMIARAHGEEAVGQAFMQLLSYHR